MADQMPSLIPRVFCKDPEGLVDFLKAVFDAEGEFRPDRPSDIRIGGSLMMIAAEGPRPATSSVFYVYVPDVDATYDKAVSQGAAIIEQPHDEFYGDRRIMFEDDWGNCWQVATPLKD